MSAWWRTLYCICCALNLAAALIPPALLQWNRYSNSFSLARSTRSHVQQLLREYKRLQLGSLDFEDRNTQLNELPRLSIDFHSWLNLLDWDRLHAASLDIQAYWDMLERKRTEMEKAQRSQTSLTQSIRHVQLDLRDLMSQVHSQLRLKNSSWAKPPLAAARPSPAGGSLSDWESCVEGYIILRDLDLYLTKLARDFLLLASRAHSPDSI